MLIRNEENFRRFVRGRFFRRGFFRRGRFRRRSFFRRGRFRRRSFFRSVFETGGQLVRKHRRGGAAVRKLQRVGARNLRFRDRSGRFLIVFEVFFVILLDFLGADRVERFRRDFGADDFQREFRRLRKARRRRSGVRNDVLILFVEFLQFRFRRFRNLVDKIGGFERDDVRLRRTVRRFERFQRVARNRSQRGVAVTSDDAFVSDLLFQKLQKHTIVQPARAETALNRILRQRTADDRLQILRRRFVVRGQSLFPRELQNQPTVDKSARIGRNIFQLARKRVKTLRLPPLLRIFRRQHVDVNIGDVLDRRAVHLRHLNRLRPLFRVQRRERRRREIRQAIRRVARLQERVVIERSVRLRFRDFADELRTALLRTGSDALQHRTQRDEREHRKEGEPRHPSLLIAAEYTKGIILCHLNCLS